MAIVFDTTAKVIVLDRDNISASELYSRWVDWTTNNLNQLPVFRSIGLDDLGEGLFVPAYVFLLNGWRVRPMESNHRLIITGNLFVEEGGVPVVATLGEFNVSVQYTVPVQAQGISTTGSTGPSASEIAAAILASSPPPLTSGEIVAAMLAAAQSNPIHADTKRMNGAVVVGVGSEANKWRGAGV